MNTRDKIIHTFAEWTAFSATRSGCPMKSRDKVYPLIRIPDYEKLLIGEEIKQPEFNSWHRASTLAICQQESILPIGWAVKIINVYLKTRIYIANQGRKGLITCIHPPIDNGLWDGIIKEYGNEPGIISLTHSVNRIKDIKSYEAYQRIIEGCQLIANRRNCLLIEVEELWQGTEI